MNNAGKKLLTRYHKISSREHEKIIEHDDDSSYSLSPLSLSLSPSQSSRDPSIKTRCNKRQARVYVTKNKRQREICKKKEKKERRKKRKRTELKYRGESCSIDARRNKIISRGGGITRIQARIYVSIQKRLAYFAWPRPKEEICLHSKRGFIFISFSLSLSFSYLSYGALFCPPCGSLWLACAVICATERVGYLIKIGLFSCIPVHALPEKTLSPLAHSLSFSFSLFVGFRPWRVIDSALRYPPPDTWNFPSNFSFFDTVFWKPYSAERKPRERVSRARSGSLPRWKAHRGPSFDSSSSLLRFLLLVNIMYNRKKRGALRNRLLELSHNATGYE